MTDDQHLHPGTTDSPSASSAPELSPQAAAQFLAHVTEQVGRVVYGAEQHVRLAMIAFLVRGHLLLEGVPGTGKTLLARCLSKVLGLPLRRIQCTPDLMPGDVLGANIFDFRTQQFALTKGPVFTEFLLVDEINRTPPKTQSALLEAMQERAVTIDGQTHALSPLFSVIATQNPVEHEGTYPLPEAQLDRFLFKLFVGYPPPELEAQAVFAHCSAAGMPDLDALGLVSQVSRTQLMALRRVPQAVRIEPSIVEYCVRLAQATRQHAALSVGLSPRATTMMAAAARASAACAGRDFVVPDDVKALFLPLARHRVALSPSAEMDDLSSDQVLAEIIQQVVAPR